MIKREYSLLLKMLTYQVSYPLSLKSFLEIVNKGLVKAEKGFDDYLKLLRIWEWNGNDSYILLIKLLI